MAAPSYVDAGTGATDAGGAWSYTCQASTAAGRVFIVHILQDGTTFSAVAVTGATNIEALDGTDNTWTAIADWSSVGGLGLHRVYIGRSLSTSAPTISGTNSTSEDLYIRSYQFTDVSTGTTAETVFENSSAGVVLTASNTVDPISDVSVTTLGPDRLALNFVAITDDNAISAFTGMTGGTWTEAVSEYADAAGTDGCIQLQQAAMASAGTINNGTTTHVDTADGWGVIGFALIGTTVEGSTEDPFPYIGGQYYG
jgi:hypothetical protein